MRVRPQMLQFEAYAFMFLTHYGDCTRMNEFHRSMGEPISFRMLSFFSLHFHMSFSARGGRMMSIDREKALFLGESIVISGCRHQFGGWSYLERSHWRLSR